MEQVPRFARRRVAVAAVSIGVVLSCFSGGYGYERDELYFRLLTSEWGYVDQGPFTPLVARLAGAVADTTWALRIPASAAVMVTTVVVALLARELGGGSGAQTLAAWGYGFATTPVIFGHVLLTATLDLPVWPAFVLLVVRAVRRDEGRWWLAAGAVAGLSTYNKLLIASLVASLVLGALLTGPRPLLRSGWMWVGAAFAVVLASPNLVFQLTHGWPELAMGAALAEHNASDVRAQMWLFLVVMLGAPLTPVWIAGWVRLWRERSTRFMAAAFPVLLGLVFVMGTQVYYPLGLVTVLFAAGCGPAWRWLRVRRWWRRTALGLFGLNGAVSLVLGLPLVPIADLGETPVPDINLIAQDSVGWLTYVRQIAEVANSLPAQQRGAAIVYASNYGEAGAVDRYGPELGLPAVYSGQNQLYLQKRPPPSAVVVVFVGSQLDEADDLFDACSVKTTLDNGLGVDNEEQGQPVAVCREPRGGWGWVWPRLRHLD